MTFHYCPTQDMHIVQKRLKCHPLFKDRLAEIIRSICVSNTARSTFSGLRVSRGWPQRGSASFTRDQDGKRFRAKLIKGGWVCYEESNL